MVKNFSLGFPVKVVMNSRLVMRVRRRFHRQLLLFEAGTLLLFSLLLVKLVPFRYWSRYLGTPTGDGFSSENMAQYYATLRSVRMAIIPFTRRSDERFTCLMQAIAGKVMLNRRGVPNALVLGVKMKHEDGATGMDAHAWLRCGTVVLLGGEKQSQYTTVSQFHSQPKR